MSMCACGRRGCGCGCACGALPRRSRSAVVVSVGVLLNMEAEPASSEPSASSSNSKGGVKPPSLQRSRSSVWQNFRKNDSGTEVECLKCGKKLKYNGSTTSNLHEHLKKHDVGGLRPEPDQESITKFATCLPSAHRVCSEVAQRAITDRLAAWCWINLRPLNIVRDQGLRDVLQYMEPGYRPPSRTHVAKLVRARHQQGLELAKSALSTGVSGVALTTDIWTSKATQAFATTDGSFSRCVWNSILSPGPTQEYGSLKSWRNVPFVSACLTTRLSALSTTKLRT